jgi:peptidoglycan hydrolase CwlO-like protein
MNFRDFKAAVNAANLHDLADTAVESVSVYPGVGLDVEFDTSELEAARDEANDEKERVEKLLLDAEAKVEELETEAEKTAKVLSAIHGLTPAESLALYLQRATDAEADAETARNQSRDWKHARDDAERECKALRKRKGIDCAIVRHSREVLEFIRMVSESKPADHARIKEAAQTALAKLRTP